MRARPIHFAACLPVRRVVARAAFIATVWLVAALLVAPAGLVGRRGSPQLFSALPGSQLPGQSEEEAESWPKSEAREAPQVRSSARGRCSTAEHAPSLVHIEPIAPTRCAERPIYSSHLPGRHENGGSLRC
jgi:hypothetical protein